MLAARAPLPANQPPPSIDPVRTVPIASLHAYTPNWTIKARVQSKTNMRTFQKKDGTEGQLFSVTLIDADAGEIRATAFNQAAAKFYDVLQPQKAGLSSLRLPDRLAAALTACRFTTSRRVQSSPATRSSRAASSTNSKSTSSPTPRCGFFFCFYSFVLF